MSPSIPIPTDNVYKFACLFGLALIFSSLIAFVASYSHALDQKVKHTEAAMLLQAKEQRTKAEDNALALHNRLVEVAKSNETVASYAVGAAIGIGLSLSIFGVFKWYRVIQPRDDQLAALQIQKLKAEIALLNAQASPSSPPCA